ncbi:hypothetical protein EDF46_3390 [Frondihabitans sp. PhB188]|nr:hypothetical protein EDF46_3390 [Frondihabitans sp. PhB188]
MNKWTGGTLVVLLLVFLFTGAAIIGSGGPEGSSACAATAVTVETASAHTAIDGYSGDQLVNATAIMNAGAALGVNTQGQTIGVMTAMGESTLENITYGDKAGPDSRGLFQQRDTWGTLAQRMDPPTAATFFFQRLVKVPNWQSMSPSAAAHAVQINADPNHYTKYFDAAQAVVQALTGGQAACASTVSVSGDAKALATNLVKGIDNGTITGLAPDHLKEIRWIAEGKTVANCGIDTRILQVITVAYQTFGKIGISDINRACTGQRPGAGNASAHVVNGGGHAVDFYSLGGVVTNGWDANAIKLLKTLDPIMASDSGTGQADCRATHGDSLSLTNISRQFADTCNHVHIEVDPMGNEPMKFNVNQASS